MYRGCRGRRRSGRPERSRGTSRIGSHSMIRAGWRKAPDVLAAGCCAPLRGVPSPSSSGPGRAELARFAGSDMLRALIRASLRKRSACTRRREHPAPPASSMNRWQSSASRRRRIATAGTRRRYACRECSSFQHGATFAGHGIRRSSPASAHRHLERRPAKWPSCLAPLCKPSASVGSAEQGRVLSEGAKRPSCTRPRADEEDEASPRAAGAAAPGRETRRPLRRPPPATTRTDTGRR